MQQQTSRKLTIIFVYGSFLSSLMLFGYIFIGFINGYEMTFKEPNNMVAWSGLTYIIISVILGANYLKEVIDEK